MRDIKTLIRMLEDLKTKLKKYKEDDSGTYSFYEDLQCQLYNCAKLSELEGGIAELENIPKLLNFCKQKDNCMECDINREIIRRRISSLKQRVKETV